MSEALASTLHSGIEIAFLLALLSLAAQASGQQRLIPRLKWGAVSGVFAGVAITYGVLSGWGRESVELAVNGLGIASTAGLFVWLAWTRKDSGVTAGNKGGLASSVLITVVCAVLVILPSLDIGLTQSRLILALDEPSSVEVVARVGAALLVLAGSALAGITLHKANALSRARPVILITVAALLVLLVRDLTSLTQILLVKGIVPLYDWLFRIIVPLVNNYAAFFYAFLAVTAVLVPLAIREWAGHRRSLDGLNPAEKRKMRVTARRTVTTFVAAGLLLALVVIGDGARAIFADRPLQLSPATPVSSENNRVTIPADSVADGRLYRFSFAAADGIAVRFLVIYKGSGIYGAGLDACEFCGAAGYRQERENVICNRCGAAINKTSIGFPGGCNPIPLPYQKEEDIVVIQVERLEAVKTVFAR